ncbi:MAG: hypothetical protein ABSH39_04630 [Candidatus Acidiferrum sp.]|jgi:hypothetical protein
MPIRVISDQDQPSAAIEIALEKPLPDYDLLQLEHPTPRDVDAVLVSQGFRDLVDDARGVLIELLSHTGLEITQLTGAICPGEDEVYRPGLWIVLHDGHGTPKISLPAATQERVRAIAAEFAKRLSL